MWKLASSFTPHMPTGSLILGSWSTMNSCGRTCMMRSPGEARAMHVFSISRFTSSLLISLSMSFLVRISRCCRLRICCPAIPTYTSRISTPAFCFSFFHRLANGFHCFVNVGYHPTHHAKVVSLAHAQHFDLAVFIHPANDRTDLGGTGYRVRSRSCWCLFSFPCLFLVHTIWSLVRQVDPAVSVPVCIVQSSR